MISTNDTLSYQATIEGYSMDNDSFPALTDMKAHFSHKTFNTTTVTTIEKTIREKRPLITTSPSITAGYDPINKQWGVMVGVSLNFNIWK